MEPKKGDIYCHNNYLYFMIGKIDRNGIQHFWLSMNTDYPVQFYENLHFLDEFVTDIFREE